MVLWNLVDGGPSHSRPLPLAFRVYAGWYPGYQSSSEIKHNIKEEKSPRFMEDDQGVLWYKGRIYVPNVKVLKDKILREAHQSTYSTHPGGNKMYHDLKVTYWWYGMKRDIAEYLALCDTYQRVRAEHQ
jgi:hypothetical protein